MARVNTVLGPVPSEELGFVAVHEHIGYGMPGSELDTQWWKSPEQRYEETVPKLRAFHENCKPYGAATYVDATGICNGRDVSYYQSLSEKTGVHIVASTGFVGGDTALPFFERAERRLPPPAVRPRDHRRHRQHGRQGRHHQGRGQPGVHDEGARPPHLPRRRAGRARDRRADLHPPRGQRRAGDRGLPRGGTAAGPRALRPRRRRRSARAWCATAGSPSRAAGSASTPSATTSSCPTRRSGAARGRSASTTSSATCATGWSTACSPPPTPTAARSAGRASRATPSTTSSRCCSPPSGRPASTRPPSPGSSSTSRPPSCRCSPACRCNPASPSTFATTTH